MWVHYTSKVVPFILFLMALFFTGFIHALLLEAEVFLVSVKLIMMAYKAGGANAELADIIQILSERDIT